MYSFNRFVYASKDSELLVEHINARGEYDGFVLNHIYNLCRVDYGHDYDNKISALYRLKIQSHLLFTMNEYGKKNGKCIVDIDEDKCNKTLLTYMEYLAVVYMVSI